MPSSFDRPALCLIIKLFKPASVSNVPREQLSGTESNTGVRHGFLSSGTVFQFPHALLAYCFTVLHFFPCFFLAADARTSSHRFDMTALERSLHRWWTMAELKVAEEALETDSQFCMWDSRREYQQYYSSYSSC